MLCLQFVAPSHTFPFFHRRPAEYGLQLGYDLGMGTLVILRRKKQTNQDEAVKSGAFPRMQCLGGIRTYNLPASTAWPGAEFAWEISDAQLWKGK